MDITQFTRKETHTVEIKDPHGAETGIKVDVYGGDSKEFRKRLIEINRKAQEMTKEPNPMAVAALAAVKSWENVEDGDGNDIDPDSDEALDIFLNRETAWFYDQVYFVANNRSLFFSKPGKS